jgi:hypothetical protein
MDIVFMAIGATFAVDPTRGTIDMQRVTASTTTVAEKWQSLR